MNAILAILTLCLSAQAEMNAKYDADLAEISLGFEAEGMPSSASKMPWAVHAQSGEFRKITRPSYRHMHAFVAAAFYASRLDQREAAVQLLQRYQCENWLACNELDRAYSTAWKANVLTMSEKQKKLYGALGEKISADLKKSEANKPGHAPICDPAAKKNPWLELEYQNLCANRDLGSDLGFSKGSPAEKRLQKKIDTSSGQAFMSSYFLKSLSHIGNRHCLQPWETKITCAGSADIEITYGCSISEKNGKVSCRNKGVVHQ